MRPRRATSAGTRWALGLGLASFATMVAVAQFWLNVSFYVLLGLDSAVTLSGADRFRDFEIVLALLSVAALVVLSVDWLFRAVDGRRR